jgi:ribosomal protein S27AE
MKRRKCELIPVSEYEATPPIAYIDNSHKYFKGPKGHFIKVTRKTCSECASTALFVGIFRYKKHNRVQRFCSKCATRYGELPSPSSSSSIPEIK